MKPVDDDGDQWEPEEYDECIEEDTGTGQETGEEVELYEEIIQTRVVEVDEQADNFEDHVIASEQLDQKIETEIVEVDRADNSEAALDPAHVKEPEELDQQIEPEIVEVSHDVEMEQRKEIGETSASQTVIRIPDSIREEPSSETNANNGVETAFEEAESGNENTKLEVCYIDNARGSRATHREFLAQLVAVTSLGLLCLCAAASAILLGRKSSSGEKLDTSPISVAVEHRALQERSFSRNWQSGPSQMSSFQKSSKHLEGCGEAQSRERRSRSNYKRESLASSDYSMGGGSPSYSYGSFTTYEKIHSKHGGEEEIVTPVRRSSGIRKQVTSSAS